MKHSRLSVRIGLALVALALSQSVAAFSLGRLRGATVLGQPMELAVAVQTSADEDLTGICVAADVYFGESLVEPSQVRARVESSGAGTASVRLSVRKPVDEPVVTVYLRTGCQTQSTRKYVLLAEFSSEITQLPVIDEPVTKSAPVVHSVVPNQALVVSSGSAVPVNSRPKSTKRLDHKATSAEVPMEPAEKAVSAHFGSALKQGRIAARQSSGARLKLQPLDLSANWEPTLRMSSDLGALPSDVDPIRRAEAAALWRALNATPEEILQEAAKRAALETELKGLQTMSHANQVALAELTQRLQAVQDSRYSNPVVYVLMGLLLVCGALLVYLLRQNRTNGSPWWMERFPGRVDASEEAVAESAQQAAWPVSTNRAESSQKLAVQQSEAPLREIDIPLADASYNPVTQLSDAGNSKPADFGHSVIGVLRAINTQEMVDVRQQADFFLTLGQYDEAIGLLYGALSQHNEANPLVYLDLISLLHKLSRKDEYEKVRRGFNGLYTCHLPEFGAYSEEGLGLLEYPDMCGALVQLWPSHSAVDYIESCLVRTSSDPLESGIDLAAFKDLLLLHSVLGTLADPAIDTGYHEPVKRVLPPIKNWTSEHASSVSYLGTPSSGTHLDLDLT